MKPPFPIKRAPNGRAMLNLGCGSHTHPAWNNLDFSYYARLARHPSTARVLHSVGILSSVRYERLLAIDPDIVAWDLRRGIPYADDSFDTVYHSHVLEHLARPHAQRLLRECRRVLKPHGILRVVVPDFETQVREYLATLPPGRNASSELLDAHERAVERVLEQLVREESVGASSQPFVVRHLDRLIRGDARQVGEVHRWMYDVYTLEAALRAVGFDDFSDLNPTLSAIEGWEQFGLDLNSDGSPYHKRSLFVEARKPLVG